MEMLIEGVRGDLRTANLQIDSWERSYNRLERRLRIQPYVVGGTVALGFVGGYFMADGIANNNPRGVMTGVVIIGTDILIYSLGRWIFKWW
jgi:hypothetical protein